ncbi:Protein of unknown function [Propionibacterium freudenreichii subsp. freudenreichii]|uniref:Uncharacterized protein n=1 Tax=Propionibacterium freudenreichii subsp. freudenreichii TaxID=66712 RepID=A0A0B7NXC6_PROFF|nr:Protein of unknown function [Propionibacterium freudenreichii]CEP25619.1 Protein of unknown function [Propionibacterium freudenreichii subsp. freudenreichii]CEG89853.1 Protein of unknown function [Propionibacterium freudenreichii]CEG99867.1 Protein of unknown function [Propionibacterium freudenreichii]CEH03844.1 Protein of unknown function [Propionibacterium freudenreichii]
MTRRSPRLGTSGAMAIGSKDSHG